MPKRKPEFFVVDILISIDKIMRGTANLTFETFFASEGVVDAVLRTETCWRINQTVEPPAE